MAKVGRRPKPKRLLMGRRKEIRFTDAQWSIIEKAAKAADKEPAVFCREAALEKAGA